MSGTSAPYWVFLPNAIARARVERVLCAATDLSDIHGFDTLDELLTMELARGLLIHDSGLEMATHLATASPSLVQAIIANDRYEASFQAMASHDALSHLIGWPDFLTSPRPWDVICAARAFARQVDWRWQTFLGEGSASRRWGLYSSFDRDMVIEQVGDLVRVQLQEERLADIVCEVAYEMAMNAMYDAPVDEFGRSKYSHDRQADIALEDDEVPFLEFATDGTTIALQIDDPYGRLRRYDVIEAIGRGLNARHAEKAQEVLNTRQGGAGLGLFRMFQLSTSLMFEVLKSRRTRVIALFDMGMRLKDRRNDLTSVHLSFRQE